MIENRHTVTMEDNWKIAYRFLVDTHFDNLE